MAMFLFEKGREWGAADSPAGRVGLGSTRMGLHALARAADGVMEGDVVEGPD